MSALLDTHTFVWALLSPKLLSKPAMGVIASNDHVLVSAVSLYEIAAKVRLGRWREAEPLLRHELPFFREQGFRFMDLTSTAAVRAGRMPGEHRDPFDRLLAATSLEMDIPILSTDAALDVFGVRRVW